MSEESLEVVGKSLEYYKDTATSCFPGRASLLVLKLERK